MDKKLINERVLTAINDLLRLHPELTKTMLGELLGVRSAKFSQIMGLKMYVPVEVMAPLCLKFNISADWLLTGRGNMINKSEDELSLNNVGMVMQLVDTIKQQAQEIGQLKERIKQLGSEIEDKQLESEIEDKSVSDADEATTL